MADFYEADGPTGLHTIRYIERGLGRGYLDMAGRYTYRPRKRPSPEHAIREPPEGDQAEIEKGLSLEEKKDLVEMKKSQATNLGYAAIQSTKPQTLGYGLND